MYPRIHSIALALLASAACGRAEPAVHPMGGEFLAAGDFDGDGRRDAAVVDRESGAYRLGYRQPDGSLSWQAPRAGGLDDVSAVTVGRLLDAGRDALALTAPTLNRIHVMNDAVPGSSGSPHPVACMGIAPHGVLALDVGGAGNTALDDLLVTAAWDSGTNVHELVRNAGGAFGTMWAGLVEGRAEGLQRVNLAVGQPDAASVLAREAGASRLDIFAVDGGAEVRVLAEGGLASNVWAAFGRFGASVYPACVLAAPGQAVVQVRPLRDRASPPPALELGEGRMTAMPGAVASAMILEARGQVLVVLESGAAAVYRVADDLGLELVQQVQASVGGARILGGLLLSAEDLVILSGPAAGGGSTRHDLLRWSGSGYESVGGGPLPALTGGAGRANVFVFASEPFVDPLPLKLGAYRAGDWSTQVSFTGTPLQVSARAQIDGGPTNGLGGALILGLGQAPAGAAFGLSSQYHPAISLCPMEPAAGTIAAAVTISPPSGRYGAAQKVSLWASPASFDIYYRSGDGGGWQVYSTSLTVWADTTLHAFCQNASGTLRSPIRSATYTFRDGPDRLDSDGDGVPDYVEAAYGLDPVGSGTDADGDGITDFEELRAGTDPTARDASGSVARSEYGSVFDLLVTPRPLDASAMSLAPVVTGNVHSAHALGGYRLAVGVAGLPPVPGISDPSVLFEQLPGGGSPGLVTVATLERYPIQTAHSDPNLGVEMLGVFPCPAPPTPVVDYTYGGGPVSAEGSNWVAAAVAAYAGASRPMVQRDLAPIDTLAALLLERKVGDLLFERGAVSNRLVSLFPFRVGDVGLPSPAREQLAALEDAAGAGAPGYRLRTMHAVLSEYAAGAGGPDAAALRALTMDAYRVCALSNGPPPVTVELPVDALRHFLLHGRLSGLYSNAVALDAAALEGAYRAAGAALAAVPARPRAEVALQVRADSFSGPCTVLDAVGGGTTYSLFTAAGQPFDFPPALHVLPGSIVYATVYTDAPFPSCAGVSAEVEDIVLVSLPVPSSVDADGNLLPDAWELLVFGAAGHASQADTDGDGYSDLQECLESTDARAAGSHPSVPPARIEPFEVAIARQGEGLSRVSWSFPARYQGAFEFRLRTTDNLLGGFADRPATAERDGDTMRVIVPVAGGRDREFYCLGFSLR